MWIQEHRAIRETAMVNGISNIMSIQAVQATHEAGNVTLASQEPANSQSSVGYHTKILDSDLGRPLFRRNAVELMPTEEIELLANHAEHGRGETRTCLDQTANRAGAG